MTKSGHRVAKLACMPACMHFFLIMQCWIIVICLFMYVLVDNFLEKEKVIHHYYDSSANGDLTGSVSHYWLSYNFELRVPKDVEKNVTFKVQAVSNYDSLKMPDSSHVLVSDLFSISCEEDFKQQAVTLRFPHAATIESDEDVKDIAFFKAETTESTFKELDCGKFRIGSQYGSIEVKQFSIFGIFKRRLRSINLRCIVFKQDTDDGFELRFYITRSCFTELKVIQSINTIMNYFRYYSCRLIQLHWQN